VSPVPGVAPLPARDSPTVTPGRDTTYDEHQPPSAVGRVLLSLRYSCPHPNGWLGRTSVPALGNDPGVRLTCVLCLICDAQWVEARVT